MSSHTPHAWISERQKHDPKIVKHAHAGLNNLLAVFITKHFGTMTSFYVLSLWMFGWMFLATIGFGYFSYDPYPFTFLLFLSNLVQLLALPILAVGQQVLSRASDKQAEQTFKDAEAILKLQDEVHRLVKVNIELTEEIHTLIKKGI